MAGVDMFSAMSKEHASYTFVQLSADFLVSQPKKVDTICIIQF